MTTRPSETRASGAAMAPDGRVSGRRGASLSREWRVWRYIALVFGSGLLAFIAILSLDPPREAFPLLIILALVVVAERFPVPLYYNGQLSVSFTGVIFATLVAGMGGGVIAGACVTLGCTKFGRQPISRPLFNFGQHVLAAAAACLAVWVSRVSSFETDPIVVAFAGAAAGLLMYATSATLVSHVISLTSGRPLRRVFQENFGWLLPHYTGLGFIAGGTAAVYAAVGWTGFVITLIPIALAGFAMQQVVNRTRSSMHKLEAAHDALASAHNEIQVLLEAIPDTILRIDSRHVVVQCHLVDGVPIGGGRVLLGKHLREVLPPEVAFETEAAILDAESSGRIQVLEYDLVEDDRRRYLEARVVPLHDQHSSEDACLLMIRDITERREYSEARRMAEELRQSVTTNTPVVLFATDDRGILSLIEGQGLAPLVNDGAALVGTPVWDIFPDQDRMCARLDRVMNGQSFREVIEVSEAIFDSYYAPLHDDQGSVSGMVGIALNITERHRVEEAMLQAQKLESLGVLAGGIAHDFNNLLVGILGNAGLALEDIPEGSPARDTIDQIRVAGERAAELARQMLAYSGRGRFNVRPIDLNDLVGETSELLRASISKRIRLMFNMMPDVPIVDADATQLRQIVMNLVINAADAIGEGDGTIRVSTNVVEADSTMLASARVTSDVGPGRYVSLAVTDTGSGMDEATIERIFDPFFTTKFTGRGLGLAAVLGIIKAHHGAIFVESRLGRGTTFRVLLPLSAAPAAVEPPAQPVEDLGQWNGSGAILIVDDDATVATVTGRALKRHGFEVITAGDGEEGLAAFRQHSHQLTCVLLDMTMPRMSGLETFEAMYAVDPSVPVLLMSGFAEEDVTEQFDGLSIAGFVQKPYELTTLIQSVRRVAERSNAA